MITTRLTMRMLAAALAAAAASTATAQQTASSAAQQGTNIPAQIVARATGITPSEQTKSSYKKATWAGYQTSLKGGTTSREIPPTDCPPLPPKDCLDTWDDELTTAAPSK